MSADDKTIVHHVAVGEGWELSSSIRHRGGTITRTYTHYNRGTALVRYWNNAINGLSFICEKESSVTTVMSTDSWLTRTLAVLTGDAK